ncbi:MAG: ubiquitin-like protein Pup, partial [Rothia mucilaginosa]|nr:ubiquitin-like protein Pup [Rothia mucilaginosa]
AEDFVTGFVQKGGE